MKPETQRLPYVDLIRLVAAITVVVFHLGFRGYNGEGAYSPARFPLLEPFVKYGYLGVDWFFMVSGLVISNSAEGRTARAFAVARASRLVPGFYACTLLIALFLFVFPAPQFPVTPLIVLANLTFFAQTLGSKFISGSYWSLPLEIVFYGWVALMIRTKAWQHPLRVVACWQVLSWLTLLTRQDGIGGAFVDKYAGAFAIGILISHALNQKPTWKHVLLFGSALTQEAFARLVQAKELETFYRQPFNPSEICLLVVLLPAVLILAVAVPCPPNWVKTLGFLGGITYPLYLLHEYWGYRLFQLAKGRLDENWAFVGILAFFLLLSALVWWFVERPAIPRLRKWLENFSLRSRRRLPQDSRGGLVDP